MQMLTNAPLDSMIAMRMLSVQTLREATPVLAIVATMATGESALQV